MGLSLNDRITVRNFQFQREDGTAFLSHRDADGCDSFIAVMYRKGKSFELLVRDPLAPDAGNAVWMWICKMVRNKTVNGWTTKRNPMRRTFTIRLGSLAEIRSHLTPDEAEAYP
jgi:hypothetical protein